MKYGIIKVKRAFLYEENGVDVVDEVFFGWSVMWEDEGRERGRHAGRWCD